MSIELDTEQIRIDDEELKETFREVAAGERKRGGFLTAFAQCLSRADAENFQILKPVAQQLKTKYNL